MTEDLTVQATLSPEIFGRFINLSVGLSLGGSATFDLEELQKLLGGEPLGKGTELLVTARYYVRDIHMPVKRETDYSIPYEKRGNGDAHLYRLGGAKLDLGLICVERLEPKAGKLKQAIAAPCSCLVKMEPNLEKPEGFQVAAYPLKGYWAKPDCPECRGKGYVRPRKNKAPLAEREFGQGPIVLVDVLPDPPEVPEGSCPECGRRDNGYAYAHHPDCSAGKAAAKAEKKRQKAQRAKAEPYEATPECYGSYLSQDGGCVEGRCIYAEACERITESPETEPGP